jgi:hypothetical protein
MPKIKAEGFAREKLTVRMIDSHASVRSAAEQLQASPLTVSA